MPPADPDRCRAAAWDPRAGGCAPRVGRLVQLGGATADRRPRRLGQPCDPADPAIAQCPGRRAEQQPTLPLGQMRRDQGEGRRQHLIQIHWMNLTSPAQPGKVTERDPLVLLAQLEEALSRHRQRRGLRGPWLGVRRPSGVRPPGPGAADPVNAHPWAEWAVATGSTGTEGNTSTSTRAPRPTHGGERIDKHGARRRRRPRRLLRRRRPCWWPAPSTASHRWRLEVAVHRRRLGSARCLPTAPRCARAAGRHGADGARAKACGGKLPAPPA